MTADRLKGAQIAEAWHRSRLEILTNEEAALWDWLGQLFEGEVHAAGGIELGDRQAPISGGPQQAAAKRLNQDFDEMLRRAEQLAEYFPAGTSLGEVTAAIQTVRAAELAKIWA